MRYFTIFQLFLCLEETKILQATLGLRHISYCCLVTQRDTLCTLSFRFARTLLFSHCHTFRAELACYLYYRFVFTVLFCICILSSVSKRDLFCSEFWLNLLAWWQRRLFQEPIETRTLQCSSIFVASLSSQTGIRESQTR